VLLIYWQAIDINGGVEEDRTLDLHVANVALSQLSYDPKEFLKHICCTFMGLSSAAILAAQPLARKTLGG
jgi:hypothetical protein